MIIRAFNQFPECPGNARSVTRRACPSSVCALERGGTYYGLTSSGTARATFTRMRDSTAERYDENCFGPGYDWLPLEHFALAVEEIFAREPTFR